MEEEEEGDFLFVSAVPVNLHSHNSHILGLYHRSEIINFDIRIFFRHTASGSFIGPIPSPGSTLSSGSTTTPNNSLHRRWLRNQVTSMEYVARKKSADMSSTEAVSSGFHSV